MRTNKREQYAYLKYHPDSKFELRSLLQELIDERGPTADLNDIDVSSFSELDGVFFELSFEGDISKWDISNVILVFWIFTHSIFNSDISNLEVRPKCNTKYMFRNSPYTNMFNNMFYFKGDPSGYLKYFYRNFK